MWLTLTLGIIIGELYMFGSLLLQDWLSERREVKRHLRRMEQRDRSLFSNAEMQRLLGMSPAARLEILKMRGKDN